ncbi:hypothetical protein ABB37_02337 [Leptomonas pyrrhocoris]|uniref:Uncharacterized protein n=1 Tax=Leptomonas pyrrhocoris TaxID=157538 RepID=A0A0M9G814_LEPPY|nr:hypothetical protein ABB37_02337 [Leptomonas pyrrhocoris]XP_015662768.1 hypothetical protein ABB37_02337 [Leptomonas pyrrhocoris]KPA84328.1 hypothetical protein ABB37_02337 [Leptomonas pyrrhocoris]KPA84329.1 hypothetical protein ABB37_02337 [Leptomonas pyrrhocoris]|eukprot:XP_015662767.1 hypothetical protein ABB37_02337 [Leptomonas pyrrhocoris]
MNANMRTSKRKRERTGSLSPPPRTSNGIGGSGNNPAAHNPSPASSPPPSPATFVGLLQYRCGSDNAHQRHSFVMRHNLLHMQALQEVLRRTSLAEMRDREIVEWLQGTERWLREFHQPLAAPDAASGSGHDGGSGVAFPSSSSAAAVVTGDSFSRVYGGALSELRLLVIGVLHTMPWWRVVETVAKSHTEVAGRGDDGVDHGRASSSQGGVAQRNAGHNSSSGGGGRGQRGNVTKQRTFDGVGSEAADRVLAAHHAITRWHVRLQVAFERVCLVLIEKSQHTVRGVLEVLLKPCQLRPPVRDGARRTIPTDSFIRVLNAVATLYSSRYVIELLEGCIADFMPRRRWVERRHHVACTAVLLYVALEGHTPAYHPRLGNSQSLQRAIELLKSLRPRGEEGGGLGGSPWRLPHATLSSSSFVPGSGTSEDSGTDVGGGGGGGGGSSSATSERPSRRGRRLLPSAMEGSVLPAGYVSATLFEDARRGGLGLRQPALSRPGATAARTVAASDTELSDGTIAGGVYRESTGVLVTRNGGGGGGEGGSDSSSTAASQHGHTKRSRHGGSPQQEQDGSHSTAGGVTALNMNATAAATSLESLLDVSAEHNNKLLAHRNSIIRVLLNRLLDMEQTLEPREEESHVKDATATSMSWVAQGSFRRGASSSGLGSPFGYAPPSGPASPSTLVPSTVTTVTDTNICRGGGGPSKGLLFPSAPAAAAFASDTATASSSARSSPAALSPAGVSSSGSYLLDPSHTHPHRGVPFGAGTPLPLEELFNSLSLPYLRILRDCATLVYGRLADDLRRQQVAGSCGNADWWEEILYFYLTVVTRVERPVYAVYLAPSLAMLSTEDEPVNVLHKLITLVTKGSMPVEQPRPAVSSTNGGVGGGAFGRPSAAPSAQPVRLRMAPPTGGSRRMVTMEERLRAARHVFPLFRFLRSRLDDASGEGVRRRLLKWTAQELRRLGGAGLTTSANNTSNSSVSSSGFGVYAHVRSRHLPSRESRLALVTFAQCAAISELMAVDLLPSAVPPVRAELDTSAPNREGGHFTTMAASGDASDSIAAALQPLLARYTLQTDHPDEEVSDEAAERRAEGAAEAEEENNDNAMREEPSESSVSSTSSSTPPRKQQRCPRRRQGQDAPASCEAAPRRRMDLRQMEYEGFLQPLLMANCPWQAWLR